MSRLLRAFQDEQRGHRNIAPSFGACNRCQMLFVLCFVTNNKAVWIPMVMNPTRKCHLQYSGQPRRGVGTDSCLWEPISQRWASPAEYHFVNLEAFSPTHDRGAELAVSVRVAAIGTLGGRPRVVEDIEWSHRLGVVILWVREKKAATECYTERKKPITNI